MFDNKGNPVKKYEPFFSATFAYEDERELVEWGVTPILRYDPLGRLIRTDFPDGTNARVVFDAWSQESWDQNDTVAGTPWLARKQAGTPAEQRAAALALAHAGTPGVARLDSLGRTFLTIADNGPAGTYQTRTALDIEGNPRAITDARSIVTATQSPDMLGRALLAVTADAGASRQLPDVTGKPMLEWTARGHRRRGVFDPLQRPTHLFVQLGTGTETLVERAVYGEAHPDAENRNLRGVLHESYDGAGVLVNLRRDFQGNSIEIARQLATDYHAAPDWTSLATLTSLTDIEAAAASLLDPETFTTTAAYDALGRVISRTTPDGSQTRPSYNEASFLEHLDVRIRGATTATTFLQNLDYNARGQRERVEHGNGTVCVYHYDPETFLLVEQRTTRTTDGKLLQDLAYEYDPVGNIVQVADPVSFGNPGVSADGLYEYDAIYQLVTAEGREHPGQQPTADDSPLLVLDHPNDLRTLRRYRESYAYDAVGNLLQVAHDPLGGGIEGWTRTYEYAPDSNRLLGTSAPSEVPGLPSDTYSHDAAGNMTSMPHLLEMRWDHADRFQFADLGGGGEVYFAYDTAGQRVRKAYDHGAFVEERIYLDGYELYRKRNLSTAAIALERQTLHVFDAGRLAALVETKTIDTSIPAFAPVIRQRYQLANHLDSTASELDEGGAVITYEEYFPYGGTSWQASSSATDVSARRYRYTGKERDDETGLYYHGARYYAPWLGRWTSADPVWRSTGNLFLYCSNRPIIMYDPDGRDDKGFWSKLKDAALGAADAWAENNVGMLKASIDQFNTAIDLSHQMAQSYKNSGGGLRGALNAVNELNPLYHTYISAYQTKQALDKGDYREAGKQGYNTAFHAGETVLVASGIAEGAGAAASRVSVGSRPVTVIPERIVLGPGSTPALVPAVQIRVPVVQISSGALAATGPGSATAASGLSLSVAAGGGPGDRSGRVNPSKNTSDSSGSSNPYGTESPKPALEGNPWHPDQVATRTGKVLAPNGPLIARELGYDKTIAPNRAPFDSHGQPVYSNGNSYITPDIGSTGISHKGGIWKMFNRKGDRIGTYSQDLKTKIGR